MKNSNKFIIILLSIIIIISTIIPINAVQLNVPYNAPNDLGEEITINISNGIYYVRADKNLLSDGNTYNIITFNTAQINCNFIQTTYGASIEVSYSNTNEYYRAVPLSYNNGGNGSIIKYAFYTNHDYIYFAIALAGRDNYSIDYDNSGAFKIYKVTDEQVYNEGYTAGYLNGYNNGLTDGGQIHQELNIVGHIEQLIGQFTGDEFAQYITPIALVLTILLIYFLFIRWLLSMIKAKGVLKVCDIIVLVACISILVVLYFPMINITTTQHQIIENVYSVTSDITP